MTKHENITEENLRVTSDATVIIDILSLLPEDFMAEAREDLPPKDTHVEQFFDNIS